MAHRIDVQVNKSFPVPKDTQIRTEGFVESKWWNLSMRIMTTSVSTLHTMQVLHPFINASTKWSKSLVSISSWSHGDIHVLWLEPLVGMLTSDVTKTYFLSGKSKDKFLGKKLKTSYCSLCHVNNFFSFLESCSYQLLSFLYLCLTFLSWLLWCCH